MDSNTRNQTIKLICSAAGTLIAIYLFMTILPYLVMFLALCGAWSLYQQYQGSNRGHGGHGNGRHHHHHHHPHSHDR